MFGSAVIIILSLISATIFVQGQLIIGELLVNFKLEILKTCFKYYEEINSI